MIIAETARLRLRHFTQDDLRDIALVMGDSEVMKYSLRGPLSCEQTQDFLQNIIATYERRGCGLWAIEENLSRKVIGYCGHYFPMIDGQEEVELGYRLARSHWGKGLATEAAMAAVCYAFERLKLPRLISIIDPENHGSIRVAEKCGLTYRKDTTFHGIAVSIYGIDAQIHETGEGEREPMRRLPELHGIFVPMVTPMFEDGQLDIEGIQGLARALCAAPSVDGLFALGATGEYMHLNVEERHVLIKALAQVERNGKFLVVNTGGLPLRDTVALAQAAKAEGIDAVAAVVPEDIENTPAAVAAYFREMNAVGIPFMAYWTPYIAHQKPTEATLAQLIDLEYFAGLKDSSRDMDMFAALCARFGETISIFQGVEMLHLPSLACGSAGIIGGGLNLYPGLLAQISAAFQQHDLSKARHLQYRVRQAWALLNKHKSFRWICKQLWKEQGVLQGTSCRESLNVPLTSTEMAELRKMIIL